MAVPTNTTLTSSMRVREQLSKMVELISPTDTPIYSMLGRETATTRTPEWATESVRASNADNAALEGDDVTADAQTQPTVVKNHMQTFDETIAVSDIAEEVSTISGKKELARQVGLAGYAIRLDIEKRLGGNYASVAMAAGTAGKFAGIQAWITSNDNRGVSGADGGYSSGIVAAATNGTQRTLTEPIFKTTIQTAWTNGRGKLTQVITGASQKVTISSFTGVVQATNEVSKDKVTVLGAVDVYKSDFGFHSIKASREMDGRSAIIITPDKWKLMVLQPYEVVALGKTGHNTKRMLRTTVTLKCIDEKQNAVIADLS